MGLGSERDLVPLGAGFDIVKRGYSRTQVEEHLERLDSDLRLIAADRDAAVSQAGDLARQMERARSQIDELRAKVDRLSQPPTTLEGLSERLQGMLRLAQEEASDTKARAEADAGQIRARAETDANTLRNRYERLIAEVDGRRVELENEHRELVEKSTAELAAKVKKADAERIKADEEAQARRIQIDEDFEIAMAARRTESMKALAEQEATSKGEAERRLRDATDEANRVRAKAAEEQRTSTAEAERRVREATDEAARSRAKVVEEQRVSKAEAERRVREATEEANRRRHEAITEAQARVQDAMAEAERRVREATEEATRRMTHAASRVEALRALRSQIAEQLRAAHALMSNATPALDPLPEEQNVVPNHTTSRWPATDPAPVATGAGASAASGTTGVTTPVSAPVSAPVAAPKSTAKAAGQAPKAVKAPHPAQQSSAQQSSAQQPSAQQPSAATTSTSAPPASGTPTAKTGDPVNVVAKPKAERAQSTTTQAIANAPTKRTTPVAQPNNGQQTTTTTPVPPGTQQRSAAQPTTPNRPAQGVRREPSSKR